MERHREIGQIVGMIHMTAYDTRVLLNIVTAGTGVVTGVDSCLMRCQSINCFDVALMVSLVRNQGNYWTEQKNKMEFNGNT